MTSSGIQMNNLEGINLSPMGSAVPKRKKLSICYKIFILILTLLVLANSAVIIIHILEYYNYIDLSQYIKPKTQNNNNIILDKTIPNINVNHKTLVSVSDIPINLKKRIWKHIIDVSNTEDSYNVEETTINKVTAIYKKNSDASEIDYYEVKLSENGIAKGYITLTAKSGQDYVIPEFSTTVTSTPSEILLQSIGNNRVAKKIVKYNVEGDLSIYDKDDNKIGISEVTSVSNSTCGCDDLKRLEDEKENENQWDQVRKDAVEDWNEEEETTNYGTEVPCDGTTKLVIYNTNYDKSVPANLDNYLSYTLKSTSSDHKILEITSSASDKLCLLVERLERSGSYQATYFTITDGSDVINLYVVGRVSHDGIDQNEIDYNDTTTINSDQGRRLAFGSATKPWKPWHYFWVSGTVPDYKQHSCCGCVSGCGPVAWAQSFGWADRKAQTSSAWSKNIYLSNGYSGSAKVAPMSWPTTLSGQSPIKRYIEKIRDRVDTFCLFGSGATTLWDMDDVSSWFRARNGGSGGVSTKYNVFGIKETRLMECARYEIKHLHRPVVLGTGWLKHYPSGVGYAYRKRRRKSCWFCPWYWQVSRWFYVKQGWGGYLNKWIPAKTFFCGRIRS